MSREERRAYQRMSKKQDPYALPGNPAVRARQEKLRARRALAARNAPPPMVGGITRRFLGWVLGGGVVAGLIAFSLAWPSGMPFAAYAGLGTAAVWIGLGFGLRAILARGGPPPPRR